MKKQIAIVSLVLIGFFLVSYPGGTRDISAYKSDQKIVEVKGEVIHAGVYEVAWEATLGEIIEQAGGVNEQGSVDSLNLGQVPANKSVIVIPKQKEEACISLNSATLEELDSLPRCRS